jgi:L-Ala-D/L-Glu epimerase
MQKWTIKPYKLPLKHDWHISRSSTQVKTNLVVTICDENFWGSGEVAFNQRYGESYQLILDRFEEFVAKYTCNSHTLKELTLLLNQIKLPNSLRFGVESAFIHYMAQVQKKAVTEVLGLAPTAPLKTSYSLPIMEPTQIAKFIKTNNLERFQTLKIKVNQESAFELITTVSRHYSGKLSIDANESWSDPGQVIKFLDEISPIELEYLEQPLPATLCDEQRYLKEHSSTPIIADESLIDQNVTDDLCNQFDGVNIKLMKSGGYLKAIQQIREAKRSGLKVMIGCMIESSLGISSALNLTGEGVDFADLDGFLHLERDPFEAVRERDGRLFCPGPIKPI